ncbi:MAG: acetyl-CoA hydrolase/transferase family protein [Candidatus Tectomicrobia bacterium]|uniref:Acetyl-CoA hydrolase/transferase family protein n=1 Tax=Tectimicrobiota bacterium TaxID=2528274 RepID=A0A932ZTE0_UNCTE|nr:acetyl-CoA hydrolase/transferase family protein [Candidatus Tectomicrobia bacterium]
MPWRSEYKRKLTTPTDAVSVIKSGDRIYLSGNAATPISLLQALADRKSELADVKVHHVLFVGRDPLSLRGMEKHFRHVSLFVGPADREAVNEGRAVYTPIFLSEIPRLYREGILPLDAAILSVSPPDIHGFCSLGVEVIANKAAAEAARTLILEVNDQMPRTHGDTFIHVSQAHKVVEVSDPLPELEDEPVGEEDLRIGRHIAELVEDGSTLQMGIGKIPNAVWMALEGKRDLGVHSEMISDGMMNAIEKNIVTGARKTLHSRKVIGTFILGSRALYQYAHDNPFFELHPADYTNDPFVIARNDKMVAVNSALQVDLTGQVCSDSIGTRIYSGFGGQLDFVRGTARSKGGKPIIAVPATAAGGKVSRIVPLLNPGAGVVTTRADVHYVVTEYGVARLFGASLQRRAEMLIQLAHPNFRGELERAAKERFKI